MCGGTIIGPTASAVPGRNRLSTPNDLLDRKGTLFFRISMKIKRNIHDFFFCSQKWVAQTICRFVNCGTRGTAHHAFA